MSRWLAIAALVAFGCGGHGNGSNDSATPEENCFDGVDDNGDGRADCADPTCASVTTCVAAVPSGWSGYTSLYDGAPLTAPTCAAPFSHVLPLANAGLQAPDATCSACMCGAPNMGVCASSGGVATVMASSWTSIAVACDGAGSAATGCTGTDACQPRPAAPFASGLCIYQAGDMTCPAPFTGRHLFYAAVDDTRGCSACTCGASSGGGACPASGGAATGSATATGPITYCCVP